MPYMPSKSKKRLYACVVDLLSWEELDAPKVLSRGYLLGNSQRELSELGKRWAELKERIYEGISGAKTTTTRIMDIKSFSHPFDFSKLEDVRAVLKACDEQVSQPTIPHGLEDLDREMEKFIRGKH